MWTLMSGGHHFQSAIDVALQHTVSEIKTSWYSFQAGRRAYALARGQTAGGATA